MKITKHEESIIDKCLSSYISEFYDALPETLYVVQDRCLDLKNRIFNVEINSISLEDKSFLMDVLLDGILALCLRRADSRPMPPFLDLDERIANSKNILEIMSKFELQDSYYKGKNFCIPTKNVVFEEAKDIIKDTINLRFDFDFEKFNIENRLNDGEVVEIPVSKSISLRNMFYIRVGQENGYLFEILENTIIFSKTQEILYHLDNDVFYILNFDLLNFDLKGKHFSIYRKNNFYYVGNIGSKLGVFLQY